jgi:hypothetical protein
MHPKPPTPPLPLLPSSADVRLQDLEEWNNEHETWDPKYSARWRTDARHTHWPTYGNDVY